MVESQLLWIAAIGAFAIGTIIGLIAGRRGAAPTDDSRVRDLEQQLARAQADHGKYRAEVSEHFVETSRRLNDLTLQYRAVYEHLADGARSLLPEGTIAIAASLAEAAIPETASAAEEVAPADDSQLDLELGASPTPAWTTAERDDELGPLLDEETPAPPAAEAARAS